MNNKYTESVKQFVTERYRAGESVAAIISDTGIPRSTIYAWLKASADIRSGKKKTSLKNYRLLENKVARLQGIIEILKRAGCSVNDPLEVKLPALESYKINTVCICYVKRSMFRGEPVTTTSFATNAHILGTQSAEKCLGLKSSASTTTVGRYSALQKSVPL